MSIVWDEQENTDLYINRVNDIGQHDPKKYYYVREVSMEANDNYYNEGY